MRSDRGEDGIQTEGRSGEADLLRHHRRLGKVGTAVVVGRCGGDLGWGSRARCEEDVGHGRVRCRVRGGTMGPLRTGTGVQVGMVGEAHRGD